MKAEEFVIKFWNENGGGILNYTNVVELCEAYAQHKAQSGDLEAVKEYRAALDEQPTHRSGCVALSGGPCNCGLEWKVPDWKEVKAALGKTPVEAVKEYREALEPAKCPTCGSRKKDAYGQVWPRGNKGAGVWPENCRDPWHNEADGPVKDCLNFIRQVVRGRCNALDLDVIREAIERAVPQEEAVKEYREALEPDEAPEDHPKGDSSS